MIKEKTIDVFETFFSGPQSYSETIEGELLPKKIAIDKNDDAKISFIEVSVFVSNNFNNHKSNDLRSRMKRKWSNSYKLLCSSLSKNLSIESLNKEMKKIYKSMDKNDADDIKNAIELACHARANEDIIYSILNYLSRYHEIMMTELPRKTSVNIDSNSLSVSMIKERNSYESVLNISFLPDGKISFFSYDTDEEDSEHSISGYMTQSGKYKYSGKIDSILNILKRDEL